MPISELRRPRCRRPAERPQRGFTWLVLLFTLAIGAAGLAALGTQWQQAAQREREAELLFRGLQLRDALRRYQDQTPDGQPSLPRTLDELLSDRRRPQPRHHLRRLWADPFTGEADWVLLRAADGGIVGVHSRSLRPLLRRAQLPPGVTTPEPPAGVDRSRPDGPAVGAPLRAADWRFAIQPATPAAPAMP